MKVGLEKRPQNEHPLSIEASKRGQIEFKYMEEQALKDVREELILNESQSIFKNIPAEKYQNNR
jgi:hypothetical protein